MAHTGNQLVIRGVYFEARPEEVRGKYSLYQFREVRAGSDGFVFGREFEETQAALIVEAADHAYILAADAVLDAVSKGEVSLQDIRKSHSRPLHPPQTLKGEFPVLHSAGVRGARRVGDGQLRGTSGV